ncbi:MAG: YggS family pyridoxal phosphate-dependent enzyme [Anaerolineae bacterium]|nr:YggS family pyridoxal phosphate-dependent enzyme [Anaerolineae bacterium]
MTGLTGQTAGTDAIAARLGEVQAAIAAACHAANRQANEVRLVAVSKTHPAQDVVAAVLAGQVDFGENRPEEANEKMPAVAAQLPPGSAIRWHMIGHIQSRKARHVIKGFALIHSLDSLKLADKLARLAADEGRTLDVLLEVNVSGEASKYGWQAPDWQHSATTRAALWEDVRQVLALPELRVHGLMTMAPLVADPEQVRPVFAALRALRDALREDFPQAAWHELSMGMSDDFPVAIGEGATIIRIGRAIFGARE